MKDALIVSALSLVPRNAAAFRMGWFARSGLSSWVTRAFVAAYGLDLDEAEGGLADYPTLEALFTRTLKPGARPIDPAPDALVSPVDGKVAAIGPTVDGCIDVAPGRQLDVAALLGLDGDAWDVAVLYLSPKDYHRVHVPREGTAVDWAYLPGTLWPVFPAAVRNVDHLFSRNERMRIGVDTSFGRLQIVLVGAFGVGRIEVAVTDLLSNDGAAANQGRTSQTLDRGAWLGTFHLGSTVVLAAPLGTLQWEASIGDSVKMGQRLGRVC